MNRVTRPRAFLAVAILGFLLMILVDMTITRVLGVACIFGTLALGVASVATPEFLSGDAEEEAPSGAALGEDDDPGRG